MKNNTPEKRTTFSDEWFTYMHGQMYAIAALCRLLVLQTPEDREYAAKVLAHQQKLGNWKDFQFMEYSLNYKCLWVTEDEYFQAWRSDLEIDKDEELQEFALDHLEQLATETISDRKYIREYNCIEYKHESPNNPIFIVIYPEQLLLHEIELRKQLDNALTKG